MHKKLLSAALAAALTLSLAGCGSGEGADDSLDGYTVGICEQMEHVSLSEATRGFKDALVEAFGEDGVRFSEGNALGEQNSCATIIDGFIAEGVDLILANATWPLQAAASATSEIPVLGHLRHRLRHRAGPRRVRRRHRHERLRHQRPRPARGPGRAHKGAVPRGRNRRPALLLGRAEQRLSG